MFALEFCLVILMVTLLSKSVTSKGCEKDDEIWICKDIYLETDKKLPISDVDLNVKNLKFESCVMSTIPIGVFNSFQNIIDIDLENNNIESITPGALDNLKLLNRIHLRNNNITEIKAKVLNSLVNLKELNLQYNQVTKLENKCFSNMTLLELLRLGWNRLEYISEDLFLGLKSLKHLFLNDNLITRISVGSFRDLPSLYQLDIEHNLLSRLEFGTISKCDSLSILALGFNNFTKLNEDIFYGFDNLHTLYISNNKIISLNVQKLLSYTPKLKKLAINNNSWFCNQLAYNIQSFKVRNVTIIDNNTEIDSNFQGIRCIVSEEVTTDLNILSRLEKTLSDKLSNISLLQGIESTVLNSITDYPSSIFLKYFEDGFRNTTFFKHFLNSSFCKDFGDNFLELVKNMEQLNLSFKNFTVGANANSKSTKILQYFENELFIGVCMIIIIVILLVTMAILCCICCQKKKILTISHEDAFL